MGDDVIVVVAGEVDLDSAPRLAAALEQALAAVRGRVVIDLGAVEYLDSSGVHCLLDAAVAGRRRGHAVAVVGVRRPVYSVLEITGVTEELSVETAPGE